MSKLVSNEVIAAAFKQACMAELTALKPGNVHIFSDGHGMVVQQFIQSADAVAAVIAQPGLKVGERILAAVEATWSVVDCNTNLGIVLLCAPLVAAAWAGQGSLQHRLQQVLQGLDVEDANLAFKAIVRANPAGLGGSNQHDVHAASEVSLLAAMQASAQRDRIAWQYAHDFADIFGLGLKTYQQALDRWQNEAWAVTTLYLTLLATYPDSHLLRKYGLAQAEEVRLQAAEHLQAWLAQDNPKLYQRTLLQFDADLKTNRLNPGTSADLTVATLMAHALQ
ncbi:triphosphoribosyl-dephospho-CoA synthase [Methylobacillus glycogenes]|uniref:triphosphoribosyl-dephospho-CoA synthase n=1 Tax=Methylobacillus glycogenes TaxID=406 RepID=UPI000562FA72|nr:triphosphoribosyl-dephospho-CoA synthase [Methylobacillus glycogenes]